MLCCIASVAKLGFLSVDYHDSACSLQVYAWGENELGQLGVGDCEIRSKPTLVSLVRESAKEVSCGYYHSAVVTSKNLSVELMMM